jgi:hypothetical protein
LWNKLNYLINIVYFGHTGFIHHSAQHDEILAMLKKEKKMVFTISVPEMPGTKLCRSFDTINYS